MNCCDCRLDVETGRNKADPVFCFNSKLHGSLQCFLERVRDWFPSRFRVYGFDHNDVFHFFFFFPFSALFAATAILTPKLHIASKGIV